METDSDSRDLDEALRHCRAGLAAIEAARQSVDDTGAVYPTHLHLSAVELATAIRLAMKVAMRAR
jgi:hypothetical protein